MRLALVTYYPTQPHILSGGVESVSYNLVQALCAYPDLELHVVTCRPDLPADDALIEGGVVFHRLSTQRRRGLPNLLTTLFRVGHVLAQVQPDLVHAHTGEFATAALRLGLPTVYTVHGLAGRELRAPASIKEKVALLVLVVYERLALRRAAHVVALTPFGEDYLRPHTHAVLHRIENPVAPRFFDLPPPATDQLLLTVGHIHPLKNQLTLVEAMRGVRQQRPDVTLHIVGGETHAAYAAALRRTLADNQLAQQVVLRGRLSPSAVMDTLAKGALLLHAAHHEHAPMVIAEAMAAGRPVVASRAGGTPALVADGETGFLVPATDAAAFAERTLQLLRDPGLRQTMGQRARAVAQQRFWPDVIAARYRAVYFAALGRPDPGLAANLSAAAHAAAPAATRH
jgi:glycosyltransferase involved in cell wall biosynthesis